MAERKRLPAWLDGESEDPDERRKQKVAQAAELPDLVRIMLATGLRIGEALAARWCDIDLTGIPIITGPVTRTVPVMTISGNVTWVKGKGLVRHEGKTDAALRVIPLPASVVTLLQPRRIEPLDQRWPVSPAAGRDGRKRPLASCTSGRGDLFGADHCRRELGSVYEVSTRTSTIINFVDHM